MERVTLCTTVIPSWALGLRAGNLCLEGIINRDLLESALELHKRDTVCTLEPGPVEEQENVLKVVKRKRRKR